MKADPAASLSLDARGLDGLRSQAAKDPKGAARQAAVQFESLFMQMVVKSMRDATPKAESSAPGGDQFTSMLDAQFAKNFAGRPGGLAEVLEKQLTRHMQGMPAMPPDAGAAQAAATQAAQAQGAADAAAEGFGSSANGFSAGGLNSVEASRGAGGPAGAQAAGKGASRQADFIRRMLPHAREAERQTGVPASFIVGQAALESGWGGREMRNADGSPSFNLFGVKAGSGWRGATTDVATTEYEGGQAMRVRDTFRSYGSYSEAFSDYARMLQSSPRYAQVVRGATTAESFAGGMQRAGYATDPQYAQKLARTIHHTLQVQRSTSLSA